MHRPPRFHENTCRNKPGKSLFIACPIFKFQMHGCVLTGMRQARRSILSSAACQCAGSALTCWGRRPGTSRGTGKMKQAMTSTAAFVLVRLLGAPAPCCIVPRMAARRASALGQPSHLLCCLLVFVRKREGYRKLPTSQIDVIIGTCSSMCVCVCVCVIHAPKGVRVCCCDQRLLHCFELWNASHAVLYALHE